MDKQEVVCLVLLDLLVTFDTVDHGILLSRLDNRFRVQGLALNWIKSYLEDFTQHVLIGDPNTTGAKSAKVTFSLRVPKGSVLRLILLTQHTCS